MTSTGIQRAKPLHLWLQGLRRFDLLSWICAALTVRGLGMLYRAFLPPNNPHAHRQTDTLGVSLRYFSRWFSEDDSRAPLLPAVLNSGDTYGIMRMEFPLVNLLGALGFVAGPVYGQTVATLIIFAWHGILLFCNFKIWRHQVIAGIRMDLVVLLIPIFSISDQYFSRYMPDTTALLLVFAAIGLSWSRPRYVASIALATIGMMIKPPAVALFGLYLLRPNWWVALRKDAAWIAASLVGPLLYYTIGLHWIGTFQDMPDLFKYEAGSPTTNLRTFFSRPDRLTGLLLNRCMPAGALVVVAIGLTVLKRRGLQLASYKWIWLALTAQLILIAALDGDHAYVHEYYLIAMAPLWCMLAVGFWQTCPWRWPKILLLLMIAGRLADICITETRAFDGGRAFDIDQMYEDCRELRAEHPEFPWNQGFAFRSPGELFPRLGLCFAERQGSAIARFGFWYSDQPLPVNCQAIASKSSVSLITCSY